MELAEKFVEEVAGGGGVAVAIFSPVAVVLAGWFAVGGGENAHIQPTLASRLFLMWRWVMEIERPEARVMGRIRRRPSVLERRRTGHGRHRFQRVPVRRSSPPGQENS